MSKVRKWSCNSCCKSFNQRQSLYRHQKNCPNEDSIVKTFTCENCSKVLTRQGSLKRHSKTCKGENVATYCSPCKKSFKTSRHLYHSRHLNRHIAQVHTGQKENRNKIKMKNKIEPDKSQVHTSQEKKTNKEEVTKSIEPEMFIGPEKFIAEEKSIDLSLLVNYFDDSSDFIPSMVGKDADGRPDSDIEIVIESTTEGMRFSSSPLFSSFFFKNSQ